MAGDIELLECLCICGALGMGEGVECGEGVAEATCGIEPGGYAEGYVFGVCGVGDAGVLEELLETGEWGTGQGLESAGDDGAVVPEQWHHVGYGGEHGVQGECVCECRGCGSGCREEGLGKVQGNASAAEILVGRGTAGEVRIDNTVSGGEGSMGLVMVGDDDIDIVLIGCLDFGDICDAIVHRNNELNPQICGFGDAVEGESVAVGIAPWEAHAHLAPKGPERGIQDGAAADTIGIVITADQYALVLC